MTPKKNVGISNSEDRLKQAKVDKVKRDKADRDNPKYYKKTFVPNTNEPDGFVDEDGSYMYEGIKNPRLRDSYKESDLGKRNAKYKSKPKRGNNGQPIDTEYEKMYRKSKG